MLSCHTFPNVVIFDMCLLSNLAEWGNIWQMLSNVTNCGNFEIVLFFRYYERSLKLWLWAIWHAISFFSCYGANKAKKGVRIFSNSGSRFIAFSGPTVWQTCMVEPYNASIHPTVLYCTNWVKIVTCMCVCVCVCDHTCMGSKHCKHMASLYKHLGKLQSAITLIQRCESTIPTPSFTIQICVRTHIKSFPQVLPVPPWSLLLSYFN